VVVMPPVRATMRLVGPRDNASMVRSARSPAFPARVER
jgi:hypothetical protein